MRILRLALSMGPTSAPYNQFTLPALDQHDVVLCTFFPGQEPPDERIEYHGGDGRVRSFVGQLWQLLRRRSFDAVHIHSPHLGLIYLIVAGLARPSMLARTILHVHSSYPVYRRRNRWMLLPCFAAFSRLVCCGQASFASFPWLYRKLAGHRMTTVRNGVDLQRVDAARPSSENDKNERQPLQLITVGHLRALKDQMTVIRAVARVEAVDVRLTVVGDGPRISWLRRLVRLLSAEDRVRFTGQVSRDQALQHLWQADLFISMSRGEGLPVAVLEALGCHCAAILSDIPPHREIAGSLGQSVRLIPCGDVCGLADEIEAVARLCAQRRYEFGLAGRLHVESHFALEQMQRQFAAVLEQTACKAARSANDVALE